MVVIVLGEPRKPENFGKAGFFKIWPEKPWKLYTFQDNVPGKTGKNLYLNNSLEIYLTHSCLYIFVELIINFMMKNDLLQSIRSSTKAHNRIPA